MTNILVPWVWAVGGVHLLMAGLNLFLPRKLGYRENLSRVMGIVMGLAAWGGLRDA